MNSTLQAPGVRKLFDNRRKPAAPAWDRCDARCPVPYPLLRAMHCLQCGELRPRGAPLDGAAAIDEEEIVL